MPLHDIVLPGVLTRLQTLGPPEQFPGGSGDVKGISDGATDSIPQSPWMWVQASSFASEPAGSDLESTHWQIEIRLLHEWAPDHYNAEVVLAPLVEKVRQSFRAHIKLGSPYIRSAYVASGSWGYIFINEIWFRYCDLLLTVVEKIGVTTNA